MDGRSIWGGTRNGNHHFGKDYYDAQLKAAGFDARRKGEQPRFNGGTSAHREVRLQADDKLYRFSGSTRQTMADQFAGEWWFDEEMCTLLWRLSDGSDAGFREAARRVFAVLPEWSEMNFCVSGRLQHDFWAIRGTTATARGRGGAVSNGLGFEARQLFVPGGLCMDDFKDPRRVSLTRVVY